MLTSITSGCELRVEQTGEVTGGVDLVDVTHIYNICLGLSLTVIVTPAAPEEQVVIAGMV